MNRNIIKLFSNVYLHIDHGIESIFRCYRFEHINTNIFIQSTFINVAIILFLSYSISCTLRIETSPDLEGRWYASQCVVLSGGMLSNYDYYDFDSVYHIVNIDGDKIEWYSYKKHFYNPFLDTTADPSQAYLVIINATREPNGIYVNYNSRTQGFLLCADKIILCHGSQTDGFSQDIVFEQYGGEILPDSWPSIINDTIIVP